MVAEVNLVEASEIDSERLAEIAKRAYESDADYGAPTPSGPQGYDSPAFYTRSLKYLGCYAVLQGEKVVGGAMVSSGGAHATIERLFVDLNQHRKGIGSATVRLLAERYPEATLWTLGSPEWNTRVPPFLESLGFRQIGWEHSDPKTKNRWFEKRISDEAISPIGSLKDGQSSVTVEGKVTEKSYPRSVRSKKTGGELTVANAALEDPTGRVIMVLWDKQFEVVKVGARLRVEKGYINSFGGIKQLNVGFGRLILLL
jgi:GNAT superfamily N-acetyltransferase